ncbi:MAG: hypothetical protein COT84_03260 [Chlamydiae bacterium CG10_big_fil_rev_8_21_14_0_10_35_9]|nr:MAG: hypothetical protein COT84_03260 [Chlamydiae bacterium CG10_big_fil_rev_8_21_14_0_10_35_9]
MASQLTPVSYSQQSSAPQAETPKNPADSKTQEVAQKRFEGHPHLASSSITGQALARIPSDNALGRLDLSRTLSGVPAQPDASSLSDEQLADLLDKASNLKEINLSEFSISSEGANTYYVHVDGTPYSKTDKGDGTFHLERVAPPQTSHSGLEKLGSSEKPLSSEEPADLLAKAASLNTPSIEDLD